MRIPVTDLNRGDRVLTEQGVAEVTDRAADGETVRGRIVAASGGTMDEEVTLHAADIHRIVSRAPIPCCQEGCVGTLMPLSADDLLVKSLVAGLPEAARSHFYQCNLGNHWLWKETPREGEPKLVCHDGTDYHSAAH
jgi:hypothetical protein